MATLEIVNQNQLGQAKGTDMEEAVRKNFQGETAEVGLYLAMAWQAQQGGYPDIAEVLKTIAWEEAQHGMRFALLNGMISTSTKDNLASMLEGELAANKGKRQCAIQARQAAGDETHEVFDESSRDEARHARMLAGLLERYFGD